MVVTELWPAAFDGPPGVGTQIGVKRNQPRTLFAGVPAAASAGLPASLQVLLTYLVGRCAEGR